MWLAMGNWDMKYKQNSVSMCMHLASCNVLWWVLAHSDPQDAPHSTLLGGSDGVSWRSTSCSTLTNDVPYNDETGFGVQFQHFFQGFFLRYDRWQYTGSTLGARSMSVIFVNGWTTENTLEMWIGTWVTRWNDHGITCTRTWPTRLVTFLGATSPMGPFHSTLSHNGSHNNYMACERKHNVTLVACRCWWQHWKLQWFLSPSLNLNFWDHIW
jgi:hypothetical protein